MPLSAILRGVCSPLSNLNKPFDKALNVGNGGRLSLIFIEVLDLDSIAREHGEEVVNEVVKHVIHHSRCDLRDTDLLSRNSWNEFIALLPTADHESALNVAARIHQRLASDAVSTQTGLRLNICATVTPVCTPDDGISLSELCAVARHKSRLAQSSGAPHIH